MRRTVADIGRPVGNVLKRYSRKAGLPPGTLVYVGEARPDEHSTISVMDYTQETLEEGVVETLDACADFLARDSVTWINVTGLQDTALMGQLGERFHIHPLTLEDILHTGQRPKFEAQGENLYMVLKMCYVSAKTDEIVSEQVSLILGKGYVLSFQEVEGDVFDVIRERLRGSLGRIRGAGCDFLAYCLIDAIVDNYFSVLEQLGDRLERVQDRVFDKADPQTLHDIHLLKRELVLMRKNVWPLRELVSGLEKHEGTLLDKSLTPYLRDLYEHTLRVIDNLELLRDMLSGAVDTYVTMVSNRMNEVMKVLTVIATIFIPLTFIAGVYGMNFENMPELGWTFGYPMAWGMMIGTGIVMALYFKRRGWW